MIWKQPAAWSTGILLAALACLPTPPAQAAGAISGTVRAESTGAPLISTEIGIWDETGTPVDSSSTGAGGAYEFMDLTPGTYFVTAHSYQGYISELYDDIPCPDLECDPTTGTPVTVEDAVTTVVDFALTRRGVIAGTVRDGLFGDPISFLGVRIWDAGGNFVASGTTNAIGDYAVEDLAPGSYFASTSNSDGFIDELFPDIPCPEGACDPTAGTPIEAALDTVTSGIDFVLDLEQGLSGQVTRTAPALPFPYAAVDIWDVSGQRIKSVNAGPTGEYLAGLPLGTYFVSTAMQGVPTVLSDVLYDGIPCSPSGCDPTSGTPVTVTGGQVVQGIDLVIPTVAPMCEPSDTRLCLLDGRFKVEATWRDFDGNAGAGQAAQLTDATGTFWFFTPDNVEVVVKVLDACYQPFNRFWVFAASLTNVEVELTVTDLYPVEIQTYFNPLGNPAEPIQDTNAFATCGISSTEASSAKGGAALARETRRELEHELERLKGGGGLRPPFPESAPEAAPGKQGTCTPAATTLCVEDGRFQVEAFWQAPDGAKGMGQAVPLSAATGYFWFFSPENVEAVVKVLNACDLASFENYWVFAAGLTDVEVLLRITDTVSGEVQEYANPQHTPFRPIQDTDSFRTCP